MYDDSRTDSELLHDHCNGDPRAFTIMVHRHRDRLWALALHILRNPEEASDALQNALIAAFRRSNQFQGNSQVTTWLHRIVVNACLDQIRRNKVRATSSLPDDYHQTLIASDNPEQEVITAQTCCNVQEALAHINPDQRAALVLVDMEGWSIQEAAVMLGCAPGTVKSRCARGRARLAPMLEKLRTNK